MKAKFLIIALLLCSLVSFGQGVKRMRGPIQMVYDGDTLNMYFSGDSLIFSGTSRTFVFNGNIKADTIEAKMHDINLYNLYNDAADSLFSRMDVQPTSLEKSLISNMIDSLQFYEIWDSIDALYLTSMPTQQQATLNWIRDSFNLTPVGEPTFTAYYGFTGASGKYLNTGFTPSLDGINYTLNSASFGIGIDSLGGLNAYHGARNNPAGRNVYINPVTTGNAACRINSSGGTTAANTRLNEIFIANRLLSTVQELYIGKTKYSGNVNSTTLVEYEIFLLAMNSSGTAGSFSTNNINFAFMGGGLSQAKIEKLNDLVDWFNVEMRMLGLLAASSSSQRTSLLQAVLSGGDKTVTLPSIDTLKFSSTIFLDNRTTLNCGNTVVAKDASYSNVFINRGATTKTFNTDITINNLTLATRDYDAVPENAAGMRGHLSFFFIKNLTLTDFECRDGGDYQYMIQLAKWENVLLDGIIIESDKDALDFLCGHDAVVRDAYIESYDDCIFIGPVGYPSSQPEAMGDVYNIEFININYYDSTRTLPARGCFVYTSSWADWTADSTYKTGDFALNSGYLYQCNNANNFSATAANAPVHTSGTEVGADGISWHCIDTANYYYANVYDISFDSCLFYDPSQFFAFSNDNDAFMRNIYPGTESLSKAYNFTVTNSTFSRTRAAFANLNIEELNFENCVFDSMQYFIVNTSKGLTGDSIQINSTNCTFTNLSETFLYAFTKKLVYTSTGDSYDNSVFVNTIYGPPTGTGYLRVINNQTLPFNTLANLSPLTGDICRDLTGIKQWDGDSWENYP